MVIWDWGFAIGHWGFCTIPNPQSTIPNPQSPNKLEELNFCINI